MQKAAALNGSSFDQFPRSAQTLKPSVKRYAQTERLLTSSAFGALKRFRDFAGAGSFPSERLQGPHICCRPRTPFSVFHEVSPSQCNIRALATSRTGGKLTFV
jgi:hypothetical protein